MPLVIDCIFSLGGASQKVGSFRGPYLGVRQLDSNVRQFSDQQLAEAKAAPTYI